MRNSVQPPATIEELEKILASNGDDLKVEITPSGEVRAYRPNEPREQGPVRVFTLKQALATSY